MKKESSLKSFGHDKSSVANLPQDVHQQAYPKQSQYGSELDDTMTGVDEVQEHGKGKISKYVSNQK